MLEMLDGVLLKLIIVAAWALMAWKTLWLFRIIFDIVHYFRSREVLPELRRSLVYFGFIESDHDEDDDNPGWDEWNKYR